MEMGSTECQSCGQPLSDDHDGACPNCGGTGKIHHLQGNIIAHTNVSATLTVIKQYITFWKENRVWNLFIACLTIITVLLLWVFGMRGLIAGISSLVCSQVTAILLLWLSSSEKYKEGLYSHFDVK